jgi:GT2 family glycosyltransferase
MSVAVIICAYTERRWHELLEAVASVQRQSAPADEIIVVIDHNPALLEQARTHLPGVRVIENTLERGLSGARNSGIAVAEADIIAFMDEDAYAALDWLELLLAPYQDPDVIGCGGAIIPLWEGGRPGWFPDEYDWVVGCTYRGAYQGTSRVRNLIGCNMSFRRAAFAAAGTFTTALGRTAAYPISCEETEFCIRLSRRWPGGKLLYEPRAQVWHRVPAQRANWAYFRTRCFAEGLSKARMTQFVGADEGLASERTYVLRTLPGGVGKGLKSLLFAGDRDAGARACVMAMGLAITAAGYAIGRRRQSRWLRLLSHQTQPWQAEEAAP